MWGCLRFANQVMNRTAPKQISLNRTMWSQSVVCVAIWSCETHACLRYYAVESGDSLPPLWDNLLVPSSRVMRSKRTKHNLSNWQQSSFLGLCPLSDFLKKHVTWLTLCAELFCTWDQIYSEGSYRVIDIKKFKINEK